MKKFIIELSYNPPLHWDIVLKFFLMHQVIGVEKIEVNTYERVFQINNSIGFLKVTNQKSKLILEVLLSNNSLLPVLKQKVERMFDLNLDLKSLAEKFQQHSLLKHIYKKYPALRIPGGWDVFETAINTIISQSISVAAARKVLAKFVTMYGTQITHPISKAIMYLFPNAKTINSADLADFGITNMKKIAIKALAKKVTDREIDLENNDHEQLKAELLKIKGIGHWTVEYIMLRCAQSRNAFPKDDLILKNYIKEHLDIEEFDGIRSYLTMYLWQHHLDSKEK